MGNQLQQFEWTVLEQAKTDQKRIVLDMTKISYIDSSAIGVLIGCHGSAKASGGELRLAGVTQRVIGIFQMTGVDKVLNVDQTKDASISIMSAGA